MGPRGSVRELGSCAETLGEAEDQNKDDLEDAMVSGERTESLYEDDKDPSHQGVTDPEEKDSKNGVPGTRMIQVGGLEETMVSGNPHGTDQAPGSALGSTAVQTCVMEPIDVRYGGHFVESVMVMENDTLPDNNGLGNEGYAVIDLETGQEGTRPDLDGRDGGQDVAGNSYQVTPSNGKKGRARFRGEVEEDDLLDTNGSSSRMEGYGDRIRDQETNKPGLGDSDEAREAFEKIGLPAPSSGELVRARFSDDIRKDDLVDNNDLPSTEGNGEDSDRTPDIIEPEDGDNNGGRGAQPGAVMPAPSVVKGGSTCSQPASQPVQRSETGQKILEQILKPVMLISRFYW